MDAGIVKTPLIGQASRNLVEQADDNAAYRWEQHLLLGYERWKASRDEWSASGKKALLFIMCHDTDAADQITQRLNTDPLFEQLNGKTINLHTNLKGRLKKVGQGKAARYECECPEHPDSHPVCGISHCAQAGRLDDSGCEKSVPTLQTLAVAALIPPPPLSQSGRRGSRL
ncbi:hypothetical protein [Leptothermofonsia sp. ETS-13]|uniref:hypothetical protein n=1 Tax=Leptothermofonsia sp. ETS-13 TaxID=3035696 RepID=UPI003BA269DD